MGIVVACVALAFMLSRPIVRTAKNKKPARKRMPVVLMSF